MLTTIDASTTFTVVAATDVCTGADTLKTDTGTRVRLTTTTTLPAGLSTETDYFMIYQSTTTFQLATSKANALAGTKIDITDTGTGTHTVTVQISSLALPFDMDQVESVYVINSDNRYTPKLIFSREEWDSLNFSKFSSNIPIHAFVYNGQLEFFPTGTDDGDVIEINGKIRVTDLNIADYTTGTVDIITNNSIEVTGSGTTWTTPMVGRWIRVTHSDVAAASGDGTWYEIAEVTSTTTLNLVRPYGGRSLTTGASAAYIIGQMPLMPENFHDMPVYKAAAVYWYNNDDVGRADRYMVIYDRKQETLTSQYSSESTDPVLEEGGEGRRIINPNLTISSPTGDG